MTTLNPYAAPVRTAKLVRNRAHRLRRPSSKVVRTALPRRFAAGAIDAGLFFAVGILGGMAMKSQSTEMFGWLLMASISVINLFFYALSSQSIGKKMVGIYISDRKGKRANFWRIVLLRNLVPGLIIQGVGFAVLFGTYSFVLASLVIIALTLVDVLPVFGKDKSCLHDRLASTRVVSPAHR